MNIGNATPLSPQRGPLLDPQPLVELLLAPLPLVEWLRSSPSGRVASLLSLWSSGFAPHPQLGGKASPIK
jgi:hypothetical protein